MAGAGNTLPVTVSGAQIAEFAERSIIDRAPHQPCSYSNDSSRPRGGVHGLWLIRSSETLYIHLAGGI